MGAVELYHGTGDSRIVNRIMTTLTYRGKTYVQNKKVSDKKLVELTYRRNVYKSRQVNATSNNKNIDLIYRGVSYQN